jgi:2-polyprenyl-3-methyl-5-hydroxy-6-metoxy-1,4-benzoquinol methylase
MKTYSVGPGKEKLLRISCHLCGSNRYRPHLKGADCTFVRCSACGLVYQNPQPVFEDLRLRYGEGYFQYEIENEANFFNLMKLGLGDIHFEELTAGWRQPKRFLDVGCATGMLLAHLRERGWSVQGVELCRESAEYGQNHRNLDIHIGTLEEALFPASHFAMIHFSHLIEHLPDPRLFLEEVRRILSEHGYLIVVTPNIDGLQARLFKSNWRSAIADHLTLFSKRTLRMLLEEAGFTVMKTVTWGGLARGTVPEPIKRPADYLAKKLGFGDVVLTLSRKAPNHPLDKIA